MESATKTRLRHYREHSLVATVLAGRMAAVIKTHRVTAAAAISKMATDGEVSAWLTERRNQHITDLMDQAGPILLAAGLRATWTQTASWAAHPRKPPATPIKASTATQWLQGGGTDALSGLVFETPTGPYSFAFASEYPQWMQDSMALRLGESMGQEYWAKMQSTLEHDIMGDVLFGVVDGKSMQTIASEITGSAGKYASRRGMLIARTESGHMLNGARSGAMDRLKQNLQADAPAQKVWHSVLAVVTRDSHANLDGTPEDPSDGRWLLGGVRCRWPSDVNLPPGERCNCMCTLLLEFGMSTEEAAELIQSTADDMLESDDV